MPRDPGEADAVSDHLVARQRLRDADRGLARALGRLHSIRQAVLRGTCPPGELDRARTDYRTAELFATQARALWSNAPSPSTSNALLPDSYAAFLPTRRHEFVRWLYKRGRISDAPAARRVLRSS